MCVEAYAAALLDGEGCIFVRNNGRTTQLMVDFKMTDDGPLHLLASRWGNEVVANGKTSTGRVMYHWMVTGRHALEFLGDVLPWLQGKREQVELGLTWPLWTSGAILPERVREGRRRVLLGLRELRAVQCL